jgi:hypothetical protein
MNPSIHYHPRGSELVALAALCNAREADDSYCYNLARPLRLVLDAENYWYLWGTSITGGVLNNMWVAVQLEGQPAHYREDLERNLGIEATLDPEVALDRLLEVERSRCAAKENL